MKKILGKKFPRHAELVSASHESEIPNQVRNDVKRIRRAFTLAETLITLMIIGVVAVLVIPAFVTNVKDKTLNGQRKTANMKLLEGFRQMRVDGKLMEKYDSTEAFVNEMKKYFKINGVCKNDNLAGCFPSSFSFYNDATKDKAQGETTVKTLDDIKDIKSINSKAYADYDNFMGINFADGVNMLIAYKKDCVGPEDGNTDVGKESVSELSTCFAYFYDVNATQSPNIKGKDIISNVAFAEEDFVAIGTAFETINCEDKAKEDAGFNALLKGKGCYSNNGSDKWANAAWTCYKQGMRLPEEQELKDIADKLYGKNGNSACYNNLECTEADIDKDLWEQLFGSAYSSDSSFYLWSSVPGGNSFAYYRNFGAYGSYYSTTSRNDNDFSAICVSK